MNKPIARPPAATLPLAPHPGSRLIVILSEPEVDISLVASRVWELAKTLGCHVRFLGLCRDAAYEPNLRRHLIAISAMVQDGYLFTDVKVRHGNNWLQLVRSNWEAGDVVAYIAGQRAGLFQKPFSRVLEVNLGTPVHVIPGLDPLDRPQATILSTLTAWGGSISFILGFLWMQMKIVQMPLNWTQSLLLYLSIFLEIGLVWGWNSLFS